MKRRERREKREEMKWRALAKERRAKSEERRTKEREREILSEERVYKCLKTKNPPDELSHNDSEKRSRQVDELFV